METLGVLGDFSEEAVFGFDDLVGTVFLASDFLEEEDAFGDLVTAEEGLAEDFLDGGAEDLGVFGVSFTFSSFSTLAFLGFGVVVLLAGLIDGNETGDDVDLDSKSY